MTGHIATGDAFDQAFRTVPRTGVIFVMAEARDRGFDYGNKNWANLGQGAPEVGVLPDAPARLQQLDLDPSMFEYGPVGGLLELREAVAELYNERYRRGMGSRYTAQNVAISGGGRAGLTRVAASLGPIHLGHFLPDYTAYEELLETFRGFVPIPILLDSENGFQLCIEDLSREILGKGLSALLLSNPCNPTGQVVYGSALDQLVGVCRQLNCALLVDEFYSHYVYPDQHTVVEEPLVVSAARHVEDVDRDPVVIVDGLTKNWRYPGLRLSWTLAPRKIIERITSAGSFLDGGPSHPVQRAALPLIDRGLADREARVIQSLFRSKRDLVLDRLAEMGVQVPVAPEGAFYVFADLSGLPGSLSDGMEFFRAALDRQVIVVPGEFFDVNPGQRRRSSASLLKGFVRLSYGPELQTLERGLDRLSALIAGHR
ncbi:MAG: aspartate aminotransferase [Rickettsiales bacterium]|nr:aspartate aminotransferase [Rickettsiales bacterium]